MCVCVHIMFVFNSPSIQHVYELHVFTGACVCAESNKQMRARQKQTNTKKLLTQNKSKVTPSSLCVSNMFDFKAGSNKSISKVSKFTSANYKSHLRNVTAVSQPVAITRTRVRILTPDELYQGITKGINDPRRTEIEIVHANFSGSQLGDLITIICELIQPI